MKSIISIISGGFDPVHEGHIALIEAAESLCSDRLVVILNSDGWLTRKKGRAFQDYGTRYAVMQRLIRPWGIIIEAEDKDGTVCSDLRYLREVFPERLYRLFFCNGGDRTLANTPETELCNALGIEQRWGVGGGKINSSSDLLAQWKGGRR